MNIGIAPFGQTVRYYPVNAVYTGGQKVPLAQSVRGVQREQDIVPTFRQALEGVTSVAETPPTARAAWRGFAGSHGLYKQSDAPGDLTRPFLCDMDNTRQGQLTAWLRWSAVDTVPVDNVFGGGPPQFLTAIVNAAAGWGFVGRGPGQPQGTYLRWNGTKFAVVNDTRGYSASSWNLSSRLPFQSTLIATGAFPAPLIVQQTGTNLWHPENVDGNCSDLSVPAAAGVGVTQAFHTFVYFDILFVVCLSGGNIVITPYRPNTPATPPTNVPQSVTYNGLQNAQLTIPGEVCCLGVAPCEGAVYLCSDRNVYAIQWNDSNNTFLSTKLFELPRITGAPVVWNGEVYIPADNRIAHIVPNQRGYDWRDPNPGGMMPPPFNGMVIQLLAFADSLIAQVTDSIGPGGHCYLRMDSNGVWTCLYHQAANWGGIASNVASSGMVPIVDGVNPQSIAFANPASAATWSTMFVCPVPQTNKNPRTLVSTNRRQRPGPFRLVTPWFDLEVEGAQKLLQRIAEAVLDASTTLPIRVLYQTDFTDERGADTFTTGCARGTGTWHICGHIVQNMTPASVSGGVNTGQCYSGSTDASGNGQVWFEFDGLTNYTLGGIGFLPSSSARYPTNKRARFCLELSGDTSGATVPTILTHLFDRLEFATKSFQRQYVLRLEVNDLSGVSGTTGTSVSIPDTATLIAEMNTLKGFDYRKIPLHEVDERNAGHVSVMTKFDSSLVSVDSNGAPSGYAVTLTMTDLTLSFEDTPGAPVTLLADGVPIGIADDAILAAMGFAHG